MFFIVKRDMNDQPAFVRGKSITKFTICRCRKGTNLEQYLLSDSIEN